jgi:lactate dehydrogenase-like 2-hydroxyacid dehydrogenase
MIKIYLTNNYSLDVLEQITKLAPPSFQIIVNSFKSANEKRILKDLEYMILGGSTKIDKFLLERTPNLKMIYRSGVGLDNIDFNELNKKNIDFYVHKGINSSAVAEHTVLLILGILRKINLLDKSIRSGLWLRHQIGLTTRELQGKQVGIVGMGEVGRKLVKILKGFDVEVTYTKPNRLPPNLEKKLDIKYESLENLLKNSDVVSLNCSLNESSINLIGAKELSLMKKSAFIVNTSRGKLINENALKKALKLNLISGAAFLIPLFIPAKKAILPIPPKP